MREVLTALIVTGFMAVLLTISKTDRRTGKIPDRQNGVLLLLGAVAMGIFPEQITLKVMSVMASGEMASGLLVIRLPAASLAGMFVVSVPLLLLGTAMPGSIGGGDVKLMAAGGLFLGVKGIIMAAALGFFCAGIYGIGLLLWQSADRKSRFPLGPFLCMGMSGSFVILCVSGSYLIV